MSSAYRSSGAYDHSQNSSGVANHVTLADDPKQLPPPPPGFQWAPLDTVVRTSSSSSDSGTWNAPRRSVGMNDRVDTMAKVVFVNFVLSMPRNDFVKQGLEYYPNGRVESERFDPLQTEKMSREIM
jgi:hypothetical protein